MYALWCAAPDSGEARVRIAGTLLQVAGIGTVALGLKQTRRHFGLPSTLESIWMWLKSWPVSGRRPISGSTNLGLKTVGADLNIRYEQAAPENETLEQWKVRTESRLRLLNDAVSDLQRSIAEQGRTFEERIQQESQARSEQVAKLDDLLARVHTGGIYISLAGLIWLAVGVVMTSIPSEIARLFSLE